MKDNYTYNYNIYSERNNRIDSEKIEDITKLFNIRKNAGILTDDCQIKILNVFIGIKRKYYTKIEDLLPEIKKFVDELQINITPEIVNDIIRYHWTLSDNLGITIYHKFNRDFLIEYLELSNGEMHQLNFLKKIWMRDSAKKYQQKYKAKKINDSINFQQRLKESETILNNYDCSKENLYNMASY